jgi:hypothetical protein
MSTAKFDTLQNAAGSKSVPVSTVVDGSAKAWVNFNGTGTVAIRVAFNVSSITDIGVGRYQVNLTTALPDANYSVLATIQQNGTNNNQRIYEASTITKTTSAYGLASDDGLAYSDFASVYSTVFR